MNNLKFQFMPPLNNFAKVLLAIVVFFSLAQKNATGQANQYAFSTSGGISLQTLSSPAVLIGSGVDNSSSPLTNIGFNFDFGGSNYTQFSVSSNGLLCLGSVANSSGSINTATAAPYPVIMPLLDDLITGTDGNVQYQLLDTAPHRILVVEWNVKNCCVNNPANKRFQVWLFEGSNLIALVYGSGGLMLSAAVGIATGSSNFNGVITHNSSNSTVTAQDTNTVWPGNGRAYFFNCNASTAFHKFSTIQGTSLQSLSSPVTLFGPGNDDVSSVLTNIGFTFNMNGVNYSQFSVSSNGILTLGVQANFDFENSTNNIGTYPAIMPLFDDLNTASNGNIRYKLKGTAPNRILVVEWNVENCCGGTFNKTFQVCLFETSNIIMIIYGSGTAMASSTVGVANTDAHYTDVNTTDHTAFSNIFQDNNVDWPGTGRAYIFTPQCGAQCALTVSAAASASAVCPGSSTSLTATPAANNGSVTYLWQPGNLTGAVVNVSPLSATTYTVTATDAAPAGCTATATIQIGMLAVPVVNVSATPSSLCGPVAGSSQLLASPFPTCIQDYTVGSIPFNPLSGTETTVTLADDEVSSALPIGFNFSFYCSAVSTFYISSNGFITFNNGSSDGCCEGGSLPNGDPLLSNLVAGAWNDLDPSSQGTISYFTTGSPPFRKCVIKFANVAHLNTPNPVTFQIILYETTNFIEIHSTSIIGTGSPHTQGVENNGGLIATTTPGRNGQSFTAANDAYRFTPKATVSYNWTPAANLNSPFINNPVSSGLTANTIYTVTGTNASGCSSTATVLVQVKTVSASCSGSPVSCLAANTGTASVSASGGTAPFGYLWSNGGTTSSISNLVAGTYCVTVTDAAGCTGTCCYTVSPPLSVTASCSGTPISCAGGSNGSAFVTASGGTPGYSYAWSNGGTLSAISGLAPGTYCVTVTDINNCTATCCYIVTQPTTLLVSCSGNNVSCFGGNNGTVSAAGTGGTPGYSYTWSNGASTASISNLIAGNYCVTMTDLNGCTATCCYTVTQPANAVSVTCSGSNVSCFGGNNGSASAVAADGTPGYSYLWSNGNTTALITGLTAGLYCVTVTDANGCTVSSCYQVTQPNFPLSVTCGGTNILCFGNATGTVSLTVNGGTPAYSFAWSNGATTQNQAGLPAGTYCVTVTDAAGCTISCCYTVSQPSQLIASCSGTGTLCPGSGSGTASVIASGGRPGYTYLWSNGSTGLSILGLSAGTYCVTVTDDNGCTTSCCYTVSDPTPVSATCSGTAVSCFNGSNGTVSVLATGGTPGYTYNWSNGSTKQTPNFLAAGTYCVTVSDANGCTATCCYTVTQPALPLTAICSGTAVTCTGANNGNAAVNATGGTSPYLFAWSNGATNSSISGLDAGNYCVTVTDANGCTATCCFTVTQPSLPVSAFCSGIPVSCFGGSDGTASVTTGGGTPGYSYFWSNGGTSSSINGLPAGNYCVTVTDANGCTASCCYTVSGPASPLSASCLGTNLTCTGSADGTAAVTAGGGTPGYIYNWNNGATTASVSGLSAGNYCVTVTDANGCTATCCYSVSQPAFPLTASCSGTHVTCPGGNDGSASVSSTGGTPIYSYSWSNGGTNSSVSGLSAGNYCVTVTDANGCTANCCFVVTQPNALLISSTGSSICTGSSNGSISILVSGGTPAYNFAWNNGSSTQNQTGLVSGNYTVTVTDANGCTSSAAETVNAIPLPSVFTVTGGGTYCSVPGTGVLLGLSGSQNGITYQLQLNGNSNIGSPQPGNGNPLNFGLQTSIGNYTVMATDTISGCTNTMSGTVPVAVTAASNWYLDNDSDSYYAGSPVLACNSPGSGYTQTVTGGNDCNDSDPLINPGQAEICGNGLDDNCNGSIDEGCCNISLSGVVTNVSCTSVNNGSIQVTSSNSSGTASYTWSNGATTQDISGLTAGSYTVTVTYGPGCSQTQNFTVNQASSFGVNGVVTPVACKGASTGSILISMSGGIPPFTFLWNNGNTSQNRLSISAGTYTLTVTDAAACIKVNTFTVTQPATKLVINTNKTNVRCPGASTGTAKVAPSGGNSPYTFAWNTVPVNTTSAVSGLAAGVYTCTVTDSNSCSKTVTITITEPPAFSVFQTQTNVSVFGGNNGSATVSVTGGTPGYSYYWNSVPIQTTLTATGLTAGTYKCKITDSKGCVIKVTFIITQPPPRHGNHDQVADLQLHIHPNPTSGIIQLGFVSDKRQPCRMSLVDFTGRTVLERDFESEPGTNNRILDFSAYPKGVYMLQLKLDSGFYKKMIVIQ